MDENNELVVNFLKEEGYMPQPGGEGGLQFKKEGRVYLTFPDQNDPLYFNLYCFMNFGETVLDREQGLATANFVTRQVKAVKVTFPDLNTLNAVSFGVEILLSAPDSFRQVFDRAISIITLSIEQFSAQFSAHAVTAQAEAGKKA